MTPRDTDPRLFFIHLMRTGGTSFTAQLRSAFAPAELYPGPTDPLDAAFDLDHLASLPAERRAQILAYAGHVPFVASEVARARNREVSSGPLITATIVRDPVQRVLSMLRRRQATTPERSLEEIYEDPAMFEPLVHNHAVKAFSLRVNDACPSVLTELVVDDERLRVACRNLETVDVIGRTPDHGRFVADIEARLGWSLPAAGRVGANPATEAPSRSLVARIRRDNEADLAFHDFALELVNRRSMLAARRSCQLHGFARWSRRPVEAGLVSSRFPHGWVRGHDGTATIHDRPVGDAPAEPALAHSSASSSG